MNALVLVAHPCPDSFSHALVERTVAGLTAAGHDVDTIDLYAEGFTSAMSREERLAYDSDEPILDRQVADHATRLRRAEILVFVYPTWWSGLPAILKGWLERVIVPGVGFTFDEATGKVRPAMGHVRRLVGVSTYGSPRRSVRIVNDNGRRIITRALRMACGRRTRTTWMALYGMDTSSPADRTRFLAEVERRMASV